VITADIAVLTASLPAGSVGAAYRAGAVAAGGIGGYSWSATGLPPGLSIDPLSGMISGTPASGGTASVVLHVSDAFGVGAFSATIPLLIATPSAPPRPSAIVTAAKPTRSQLSASLRSQLTPTGMAARLSRLAKRKSYSYRFNALEPGKLTISWYYLPKGAHISRKVKPVLFASGQLSFKGHEGKQLMIRLTKQGRGLIGHRARLELSAKGSFTPSGEDPLLALAKFKLNAPGLYWKQDGAVMTDQEGFQSDANAVKIDVLLTPSSGRVAHLRLHATHEGQHCRVRGLLTIVE